MNKQELASKIWAGANELRGKVSASNYKDYMLGFIFYKYLSDKEVNYLKNELYYDDESLSEVDETDDKIVKNCQKNIGYFISYNDLFSTWIQKGLEYEISNVRTALSAFDRLIGTNYKKVYNGIFDTLEKGLDNLGTGDPERTKASRKLISLINEIPMDGSQDYDVLGFVYEFLLKNFAANAGKAGEFYTPYEASVVMSEIIANHLKDRKEISIYDPTSGSGSLLINIGKSVSKHMQSKNCVKYYAQELIENTYNLTRMNLIMRDVLPDNIIVRNGDTLGNDWPFFDDNDRENTYDPVFVDGCCSNPPYSQSWNNDDADNDVRFSDYGVAPKSKADYAFLLHNLYHLKHDGIMTIVMPHGVLFRSGDEGKIRKNLIENHNIETIIGMPSNLFFGTGIQTIIMVLKKERDSDDVLIIDASQGFMKDGNKNRLRSKDVRKIIDAVIERKTIPNYSRLVSKQEIMDNGYNLNISRYVSKGNKNDIWDIYSTMFGGIPNYEIDFLSKYWDKFPSLKSQIFKETNIPYSNVLSTDFRSTINDNSEVKSFIKDFSDIFKDFPSFLKEELINNYSDINIAQEENKLSAKLKAMIPENSLVDYYDSYQVLSNSWAKISLDLELLQTEGFECIKQVDPVMVFKKNSKTKESVEVQDGWKGHIIPFELVQEVFYSDKKQQLEELSLLQERVEAKKNELLDSIDPEDKIELLKDDSDEIDSKKLNAMITKLKKMIKNGAEFEEDSYESIIINVNEVNEKLKEIKKEIKTLKEFLEDNSKAKIESLTEAECKEMLYKKWIDAFIKELFMLPIIVLDEFEQKLLHLVSKYNLTYKEVSTKISDSKSNLSNLIPDLIADEFDTKGLEEFKDILGGKKNEQ